MKMLNKYRYSVLLCLVGSLFILLCSFGTENVWATHAATTNGEIENRPAPVFRRVCLSGTSAGNYCKQNSECPGSACANRNVGDQSGTGSHIM